MANEIIYLGYTCPACRKYNVVISSGEPQPSFPEDKVVQCECGRIQMIQITDIQTLEVCRVKAA